MEIDVAAAADEIRSIGQADKGKNVDEVLGSFGLGVFAEQLKDLRLSELLLSLNHLPSLQASHYRSYLLHQAQNRTLQEPAVSRSVGTSAEKSFICFGQVHGDMLFLCHHLSCLSTTKATVRNTMRIAPLPAVATHCMPEISAIV